MWFLTIFTQQMFSSAVAVVVLETELWTVNCSRTSVSISQC